MSNRRWVEFEMNHKLLVVVVVVAAAAAAAAVVVEIVVVVGIGGSHKRRNPLSLAKLAVFVLLKDFVGDLNAAILLWVLGIPNGEAVRERRKLEMREAKTMACRILLGE